MTDYSKYGMPDLNNTKIWVTSDLHFQHVMIAGQRGFATTDEMDEALLANINGQAGKDDLIICCGDFAMGQVKNIPALRARIKCNRIVLVYGNHDKAIRKSAEFQSLFMRSSESFTVKSKTARLYCHHYAHRVWEGSHYGVLHAYGHSHGSLAEDPNSRSRDVGVDTNGLKMYEFEELCSYLSAKTFLAVDHHTNERF